jgi:hypothetical protein
MAIDQREEIHFGDTPWIRIRGVDASGRIP